MEKSLTDWVNGDRRSNLRAVERKIGGRERGKRR